MTLTLAPQNGTERGLSLAPEISLIDHRLPTYDLYVHLTLNLSSITYSSLIPIQSYFNYISPVLLVMRLMSVHFSVNPSLGTSSLALSHLNLLATCSSYASVV